MGIKGFQGTSLLDYPGRIASLIFFGGCNLTCPFCHNPALVENPEELPDYPAAALLEDLQERRSFIDGVVITGGEPTADGGLVPFLRQVKSLDLRIKLDTNGLAPTVLREVLGEKLVDYLAIDIKTAPERYGEMHPAPVDTAALHESVRLVLGTEIEHEFRTTCVPGYVEEADVRSMGELIRGGRRWVLQQFVPAHAMNVALRELDPHSTETIASFRVLAGEYVGKVSVRGV